MSSLPESKSIALGPLKLLETYKSGPGGVIEATFRLEIPKRRISAQEYEDIQASIEKHRAEFTEKLTFVPETAELLAIGQTSKALTLMRENVAQHDGDAPAHVRMSRLLVSAGLGIAARTEAERATTLDPNSSQAWQALAWAWQNDLFGRLRQGDWKRGGGEGAPKSA